MTFDVHDQATIRRVFDAVVGDLDPAPSLPALIERRSRTRLQPVAAGRSRRWLTPAVAIGAVALVTGAVLMTGSTTPGPAASDEPATSSPVTTVPEAPTTAPEAPVVVDPYQGQTFTGEGTTPDDILTALRLPAGRTALAWGVAGGEPWALVTYLVAADPVGGKPAMTCITILPLEGENYCADADNLDDGHLWALPYAVGEGGVIFVHAVSGAVEVRVAWEGSSTITTYPVHGESFGAPPSAVIPTATRSASGVLTAHGTDGEPIGDPLVFSYSESAFNETPLGG